MAVKNRFQVFLLRNPLPSFYPRPKVTPDWWKCYLFHRRAIFPCARRDDFLWYAYSNVSRICSIIILGNVFSAWISSHGERKKNIYVGSVYKEDVAWKNCKGSQLQCLGKRVIIELIQSFFYQNKKCVGIKPKDTFLLLLVKRRSILCVLGRILYKIIKPSIIYNNGPTTVLYLQKLWEIVALHIIKFEKSVTVL